MGLDTNSIIKLLANTKNQIISEIDLNIEKSFILPKVFIISDYYKFKHNQ